jgi:hypothetical protein
MYVGFEIEIESCEDGSYSNVLDLVEKAYPITSWSREQGVDRYHYHEGMSQQGLWRVESDASLNCGAEFIMPPLDKVTGFALLEKFFKLIDESGCRTSNRCGLHLNISDDNRTIDNVNAGYFITNINYRLLAKLWPDRAKDYNTYCIGLKHILSSMLNNRQVHFSSDRQEQKNFQKEILKGHNNMVNMRFSTDGEVKERFEIRAMGGKDYHKKLKEIIITTNMFEELLKKSCEVCENTHTNKKIISYINRLHIRHDLQKFVWVPTIQGKRIHSYYNTLIRNLHSIKNIHKHGAWNFLEKIDRVYTSAYSAIPCIISFDAYCVIMLQTVSHGIFLNNAQWDSQTGTRNDKIIRLTNEAIYHIVKYMSNNPTVYQPSLCTKIMKRYMTGRLKIVNKRTTLTIPESETPNKTESGNNKMVLTIPKSEKQRDILWLARHMYMFDSDTRQEYINKLSKHMLVFINKHKEKYGKGILRMSQRKMKELSN